MPLRRSFLFLPLLALFLLAASARAAEASAPPAEYANQLVEQALAAGLQNDSYWHILLHYRSRLLGGVKSEIDSPAFFNAREGRRDPAAELAATLRAFFEPMPEDPQVQHPQCRFIDRYVWLKSRLGFDPARLPERPCKEYGEWRAALDPESVTLIFSSYYMNNPSSMFGHTLLRLNHRNRTDQDRLLDYGVNYAANPTTSNALLYGILGITGGFPGYFSNIPYYMKVREYNDAESRDLWEYDLNLNPAQIDRMMAHLWTLGHVQSSYYFLDKNCSFMVLALLDAADPELRLGDEFLKFWVIPSDTVRALSRRPGLVKSVKLRPSIVTSIQRERAMLTEEQRRLFFGLIASADDPEARAASLALLRKIPDSEATPVLDIALDWVRFRKVKSKDRLTDGEKTLQNELLLARSERPAAVRDVAFTAEETQRLRPDQGHETVRASAGSGYDSLSGGFADLGWRAAFHDLNAETLGYPSYAEIELLDTVARYYPRESRLQLERLTLLNILSLTPMDRLFGRMSWGMRLGRDTVRDLPCGECSQWTFSVGGGATLAPTRWLMLYALARGELSLVGDVVPGYRFGPLGEAGMLLSVSEDVSVFFTGAYHKPVMGYTPAYADGSVEGRVSTSTNTELRLRYELHPLADLGELTLNVYF